MNPNYKMNYKKYLIGFATLFLQHHSLKIQGLR